jgi:hypothetical protein
MVNYQNGKIYRLVCSATGKQYVGSTTQPLSKRLHGHKLNYECWQRGKHHYVSSYDLFETGEVEVFLLEDYPCDRKEQLHARERHWIETLECVNKRVPTRTHKEWAESNKESLAEKSKAFRETNKEALLEKKKAYRETNRQVLCEKQKDYYKENKEKRADYSRHWYEENRDRILEKGNEELVCVCGSKFRKDGLSQHKKTKKHQAYEETLKK